jgi:hypothetical protein
MRRLLRHALVLACVLATYEARAQDTAPPPVTGEPLGTPTTPVGERKPIVVWPTLTPAGDDVAAATGMHRPAATEGTLYARTQELDATLRDAVQDLGFTLDIADAGPVIGHARDLDLVERATKSTAHGGGPNDPGTWVVSARLEALGGDTFILRIVAVPPRGKQLRVRVDRVNGADVAVRGLIMLRDLLSSSAAQVGETGPRPQESAQLGIMSPLRSQGRAVLAANAALWGAFVAYSVQRASGSEDPRILYPLLTLGTGVGLGGALLVAEEWDIGTGDAWVLAGGAWWGTASGILIANGQHVQPLTDRYAWGVGGGLVGLGLGTFALTRGRIDEGDATLVHSGAAIGLGLGSLGDFFYRGDLDHTPYTGAGFGSAIGLLSMGTVATFAEVSPSRVLLVDLGAGLGAATGAALGSPLVFEEVTPEKTRGFVAATFGGTLLGGAAAWWLTRDRGASAPPKDRAKIDFTKPHAVPFGGVVGGIEAPAYGLGMRGIW